MAQEILKPLFLDETGKEIVTALQDLKTGNATNTEGLTAVLTTIAEQLTAIKEELQKQNQTEVAP